VYVSVGVCVCACVHVHVSKCVSCCAGCFMRFHVVNGWYFRTQGVGVASACTFDKDNWCSFKEVFKVTGSIIKVRDVWGGGGGGG
jgi:hypothetical protein